MITLEDKTVFVTGAGFTKAFLPEAPLLEDKYDFSKIKKAFADFAYANRILEKEEKSNPKGMINLERLMTRLQGGMPYDSEQGGCSEIELLLSEIKKVFLSKLEMAKKGSYSEGELDGLAKLCIEKHINIITFNYDDLFDKALWGVKKITNIPSTTGEYWHPDGGYGFFCPPSEVSISIPFSVSMDQTAMSLLKLHGSVNWRIRKGHKAPCSIDAICHYEPWISSDNEQIPMDRVESHLEAEPFIVPPILTKESLVQEPILRLTWSKAYQILSDAQLVVFLGYSFPITDFASRFLFSEAMKEDCKIFVVNFTQSQSEGQDIKGNYCRAFPKLEDSCFYFEGALKWSQNLVSEYTESKS